MLKSFLTTRIPGFLLKKIEKNLKNFQFGKCNSLSQVSLCIVQKWYKIERILALKLLVCFDI